MLYSSDRREHMKTDETENEERKGRHERRDKITKYDSDSWELIYDDSDSWGDSDSWEEYHDSAQEKFGRWVKSSYRIKQNIKQRSKQNTDWESDSGESRDIYRKAKLPASAFSFFVFSFVCLHVFPSVTRI
jgi:hypothetical protein